MTPQPAALVVEELEVAAKGLDVSLASFLLNLGHFLGHILLRRLKADADLCQAAGRSRRRIHPGINLSIHIGHMASRISISVGCRLTL